MIDKIYFYARIRETHLFNVLSQLQVNSLDAILNECDMQGVTDLRQVAYIFATSYWECNNPKHPELRNTPMKEFGGETYLRSKTYYPFYGRGFSQLTWHGNYQKEAVRLKLDLVSNPDLILDPNIAANSHVYCMVHGIYTGKKLSDYINALKCDYVYARRIVNGKDKADLIAGYAQKFFTCLKAT